jgi:hypothetical protein
MDSIEGFTKKYKVHRLVYYETFDYVLNAIRREKQLKGLAAREENRADRKDQPALAGSVQTLGTRNAVPRTDSRENSLMRHRRGHILGMVRLALAPPSHPDTQHRARRGPRVRRLRIVRASLTTTGGNGLSWN